MLKKIDLHIRAEIFFFCVFVSLMLFQTSYKNLGTITAGVVIILTIVILFCKYKSIWMTTTNALLLCFVMEMLFCSLINGRAVLSKISFLAQIILFIFITYISVSEKENKLIRNVYELSCTFYSAVIIYSCLINTTRYIHSGLIMFGTVIDPNFAALPLVASTVMILDHVVKKEKIIFNISKLAIVFGAIMFTSSRAAFVGMIVVLFLFLCSKLFSRNISIGKTLLILFFIILVSILFVNLAEYYFPEQLERMINLTGSGDGGNGRIDLWERSISEWENHPVFGIGLDGVVETYGKATHNTYLQLLTETGILGFGFFISFIIILLLRVKKVDLVLCIAFCGFLVQIAFVDALQDRCLWCMLTWIALLPEGKFKEIEAY